MASASPMAAVIGIAGELVKGTTTSCPPRAATTLAGRSTSRSWNVS